MPFEWKLGMNYGILDWGVSFSIALRCVSRKPGALRIGEEKNHWIMYVSPSKCISPKINWAVLLIVCLLR